MVSINYSEREVCCKIVFYGPGLSGKTTNLQYIHTKIPVNTRGKLISLATEADRTLYFDFLPINIGTINGFQAKFQLYTVPGQVYYNATRKLVLRGVDGLVFVADSQPDKMDENIESWANLMENLHEYGYDPEQVPIVIQYNKRDLPGVLTVEEMHAKINQRGLPHFEASATIGNGVFDTLKLIIKMVLDKAKSSNSSGVSARSNTVTEADSGGPEVSTAGAGESANSSGKAVEGAERKMADDDFRPYPGSDRQAEKRGVAGQQQVAVKEAPVAVVPAPPPEPKQVEDVDDTGKIKIETKTIVSEQGQPESVSAPTATTVAMARSLRRRDKSKKRGFFKRLFGI